MRTHSQIFFRRSSKTLTLLFLLSMIYLLLELLLMTHKFHFYSLLCALALLAIFGLNYFDKLYIKFVIVLLLVGSILDFFWLMFKSGVPIFIMQEIWSPSRFGHDSQLNSAWYKLIVLMLVGEIFLKLVIALILLSYRNNKEVESMNIFGYSVVLSSDSSGNLITNYLETIFR